MTRRRLTALTSVGLVGTLAAGLGADVAVAATAPRPTPTGAAALSAVLDVDAATPWYAGGQFTVRNDGGTAADWTLDLRVPHGELQNWASWATETEQVGDHVTIASTQPLPAGGSISVSFGIPGDGTDVPTVASCSLDGAPVAGCSADDDPGEPEVPVAPEPEVPDVPGDAGEPADVTAPGAVADLRPTKASSDGVDLSWTAATDDREVVGYDVRVDGGEPRTVTGTTTTVGGLGAASTHAVTVAARDAAGNVGAATAVPVTTARVPFSAGDLDVRKDTSTVPVLARGDAVQARDAEGRMRRESEFDPTGRFAHSGDLLEVDVPEGVEGLQLVVGLHGQYAGFNGGTSAGNRWMSLRPGRNEVRAPIDGFVHVADRSAPHTRATTVEVTGGDPVATFVEGASDEATFERQVDEFRAPFGLLVGDNVMVEVQKWALRDHLIEKDIDAGPRIRMLERFVAKADDLFGLDRDATGTAGRAPHRLLITNADTGRASANASDSHVEMHNGQGAMRKLLSNAPADQRLFWHELGHMYQPDWMNWNGMNESAPEITATANQEHVAGGRPVNWLDTFRDEYEAWFRTPVADRDFATAPESAQRLMFDQLRRAYGEQFYARMAEWFRVERLLGRPVPTSSDTTARQQEFALVASEIAGQDLTGFFDAWGIPLTGETRATLEQRPDPSFPLHENRWRPTDRVEHLVTMTDATVDVAVTGSATWGQQQVGAGLDLVHGTPTAGATLGRQAVSTTGRTGAGAGTAAVEVVAADGSLHAGTVPVDVRRGSVAEFRGGSDRVLAALALDPSTQQLTVHALSDAQAHPSSGTQEYVSARLVSTDGRTVASSSIKGVEFPHRFVRQLDGTPYEEGQHLVLGHLQARDRLSVWSGDAALPAAAAQEQAFRIEGGRLVPEALSEVPGR